MDNAVYVNAYLKARDWLEGIERIAGDDEQAHAEEDRFREWALRHVAEQCPDARVTVIALMALATNDIDFSRWCV